MRSNVRGEMRRLRSSACQGFARTSIGVAVGFLTPGLARAQTADDPRLHLEWIAPSGCPTRTEVIDDVVRILAPPVVPAPEALIAQCELAPTTTGRWRAHLVTASHAQIGERTVDGDTCASVAHTAAVMLALAIDPSAAARTSFSSSASPAPSDPPSSSPTPSFEPPRTPPPITARRRLRGVFFVGAGAAFGLSASVAPGVVVGSGLVIDHFRLEIGGWYLPSQRAATTVSGAGVNVQLFGLAPRACGVVALGAFETGACGGIEFGWMIGDGTGISDPHSNGALWVAGLASVRAAWTPNRWFLLAIDAGPAVTVLAPSFDINPYGTVFQPAPISARAALTTELRF